MRAIPGVINAGAINRIPFTNVADATFYLLEGQSSDSIADQVALIRDVSRDYFATVGARLREGRFFDTSDRRSDSPVAIVNEPFANRHFPGRSPLGQRFKFGQLERQGLLVHDRRRRESRSARAACWKTRSPRSIACTSNATRSATCRRGIVVRTAVEPASIVSGGPAGDLVGRQESAAGAHSDDGRDRRPPAVDAVAEHGAVGRIRSARAAARVAGNLRSALLRRDAAHQRDRRAHGVRRDLQRDPALLRQTRLGVDARRTRHWPGAGGDRVALDDDAALRLPARLRPDCRRGIADSRWRSRHWRVSFPRAAPRASIR